MALFEESFADPVKLIQDCERRLKEVGSPHSQRGPNAHNAGR